MMYTFFYILSIVIIFVAVQSSVTAFAGHAVLASLGMLFAVIYALPQERQFLVLAVYGIFLDILVGSTFGLYTVFFLSIATVYGLFTKNMIRTHSVPLVKIASIVTVSMFLLTLLHDKILSGIAFTFSIILFIALESVLTVGLFIMMYYFLRRYDHFFMRRISQNKKKHI